MPPQPNDILLAFKHIALSDQLNGAEKQFAAFLVDSYNRRTGRCDPSEETAAHLLRKHKRTIIRAGNRLCSLKFFFETQAWRQQPLQPLPAQLANVSRA